MLTFKQFLAEELKPRICRSCGDEFTKKPTVHGFIDQCSDCGRESEEEAGGRERTGYIHGSGMRGGQSVHIEKKKLSTHDAANRLGGATGSTGFYRR